MSARQREPHETERELRDEPPTLARREATDAEVHAAVPELEPREATDAEVRAAIEAAEERAPVDESGIRHSRYCEACGAETYEFERCHECGDKPWRAER